MTLVAICLVIPQRMRLSSSSSSSSLFEIRQQGSIKQYTVNMKSRHRYAVTEIWRFKDNGVTTLTFGVTRRHRSFDSRGSTSYGWSIMTMHLAPLWRYVRLKFFQEGSSKNSGRSPILHWSLILLFAMLGT